MLKLLGVRGFHPHLAAVLLHGLAILHEPLPLVHDVVVEHPLDLDLVRFCPVRVEHNVPVAQVLVSERRPIRQAYRAWAWRPLLGEAWLEARQHQCLAIASFDDTAPLLPLDPLVLSSLRVIRQ
eukprot:7827950-Pyramimonas_sp.AAC.1